MQLREHDSVCCAQEHIRSASSALCTEYKQIKLASLFLADSQLRPTECERDESDGAI